MNTLQETKNKANNREMDLIRDITFNQMKIITFAHARAHWR